MSRVTRPSYVTGESRKTLADTLARQRDVDVDGKADEDGLFYDSTTGKWVTTPWASNPHRRETHISMMDAGAVVSF